MPPLVHRPLALLPWASVLVSVFHLACSGESDAEDTREPSLRLGEVQQGVATYYDATGGGACGFEPSPAALDVAAMNALEYATASFCGACVRVEGPSGEVTVRIVDLCPECEKGHLDLGRQAFEKVAPLEQGRVDIRWQVTPCAVEGPVRYRFKEGSSQWWTAIQVRNHRVPVRSLEWKDGATWVSLPREAWNYFVAENGVGPGPVTLRLTPQEGEPLTDTLPGVQEGAELPGAAQFGAL